MKDDRPFMPNSTFRAPRKGLAPVSKKRARERRMGTADTMGPYFAYVKEQYDCALSGHPDHQCRGEIDAHHVVFVSQGGKDEANLLPLCRLAHDRMHALGSHALFDAEWSIDSAEWARVAWEKYLVAMGKHYTGGEE